MRICTLIPAYKEKYIKELLQSLQSQTIKPYRIIFSDDSPGAIFTQRLFSKEFENLRNGLPIEVISGPRTGAVNNFKNLFQFWNRESELFHLFLDDDVIFPDFYERHLVAHISGNFSCSISRRWESTEDGQPLTGQPIPEIVANSPSRFVMLDSDFAFMSTAGECKNWFGEFSNVVLRNYCDDLFLHPFMDGVSYAGLWDLGAFLAASMIQPVAYIQDNLGYFRKGPNQNSAQSFSPIMKAAIIGYVALNIIGRRIKKISNEQAIQSFKTISNVINYWYADQADVYQLRLATTDLATDMPNAEENFLKEWNIFLKSNNF